MSEFGHNGFGDGYSHDMYIGNVARFTLQYSYSHDAKVGHLVKSRAAQNIILYNRLRGETGGCACRASRTSDANGPPLAVLSCLMVLIRARIRARRRRD